MHRPLPQDHPILLEKGVPFHHPLISAIQHPSPHGGTCVFCKWESRHPGKRGHDLNPMDLYTSMRPYQGGVVQQPLLVAERAKAPLVTQKSRSWHWKLHCKDCVNSQCEEADHSGHTSRWDLSPWAVSFWDHAPIFHIFSVLCIQFSPFLTLATAVQKRLLTVKWCPYKLQGHGEEPKSKNFIRDS